MTGNPDGVARSAGASSEVAVLIERLGMQPHPEGGWWCQTWRTGGLDRATRGDLSTIAYLLEAGEVSRWHRVLDATEVWFHHAGAALELSMTAPDAGAAPTVVVLGTDLAADQQPQAVVPSGWWQSATATDGWVLVGCVVTPAFIDEVFEMAPDGWTPGP